MISAHVIGRVCSLGIDQANPAVDEKTFDDEKQTSLRYKTVRSFSCLEEQRIAWLKVYRAFSAAKG